MRVGVDARHLGAGRGVARYLDRHARGRSRPPSRTTTGSRSCPGHAAVAAPPGVAARAHRGSRRRALFGAAALTGRPRLDRLLGGALDVRLAAGAGAASRSPRACRCVLTVHDRSFEARPAGLHAATSASGTAPPRRARLAARARIVVVDSAATRARPARGGLAGRAGAPAHRPAGRRRRRDHRAPVPEGPYLLFVGALEPRKGIDVLAGAYRTAPRTRARGRPASSSATGRLAALLDGIDGRRRLLGAVDDAPARGALRRRDRARPALVAGGLRPARRWRPHVHGVPSVLRDLPVFRGDARRRRRCSRPAGRRRRTRGRAAAHRGRRRAARAPRRRARGLRRSGSRGRRRPPACTPC